MSEVAELERKNAEYIEYIKKAMEEHGAAQPDGSKVIQYKKLNEICEQEFEGLRLLLKSMKTKKIVNYAGVICMDPSAMITLLPVA